MATFTPRLTMGNIYSSPYYTTYNSWPTGSYALSMPNCTAYAYGRWNEISGVSQNPYWGFTGDGGDWYNEGVNAGYQHYAGWKPQVGALVSWSDSGAGHVAVVEQVNYDSNDNPISMVTSNSMYRRDYGEEYNVDGCAPNFSWLDPSTGVQSGSLAGFPFFFTDTINASDPTQSSAIIYGTLNGFIYHPDFPPDVPPTPTPTITKKVLWMVSLPNRIRRMLYGYS